MLEKFTIFITDCLSLPMEKLAAERHIQAVRNAIVAIAPLLIVGSLLLIIAMPPLPQNWGIYKILTSNAKTILLPYRMTMFIMSIYVAFGIGSSLANSYELDSISGGILAVIAFLCTIVPVNIPDTSQTLVSGWVIPIERLGGEGIFVTIITGIIAVEIYRVFENTKLRFVLPTQVPPAVANSFMALTPTLVVILGMSCITYFLNFDWYGIIYKIIQPLVNTVDTLPSVLIITFLITFFWSFGIHGASIIGVFARPFWLILLENNATAMATGQSAIAVGAEPFYQWYIWIGGSGCTIGLAILMITVTKSKICKNLGKTAFLPAIFNINEPLIFGTPIVLNATLIIPFILTPMICATIAWIAISTGLVGPVVVTTLWTLPGPIGAYISSGGDFRAVLLSIVLIIISVIVYYPFVKIYDKKLLEQEKDEIN